MQSAEKPAGQYPPLPCRASPPQGGRLRHSQASRNSHVRSPSRRAPRSRSSAPLRRREIIHEQSPPQGRHHFRRGRRDAAARFGPQARDRQGSLYRRHAGAGRHAARLSRPRGDRAWQDRQHGPHGRARGTRRGRRADGRRHSRRERHLADRPPRRAGARGQPCRVLRPADLLRHREHPRRGAACLPPRQGRVRGRALRGRHRRPRSDQWPAGDAASQALRAAMPAEQSPRRRAG